jgi:hypothetical protein
MALEKWRASSGAAKFASIGMTASALLSIIIGFAIIDELGTALGMLNSFIDVSGILGLYILLFFAIDVVVAIGLFFVKPWARNLTMYWGVLSIISIVTGFKSGGFSTWFIPQIITVISAIAVLLAKGDFVKEAH